MIIKAALLKNKLEVFNINVTKENQLIVKRKLQEVNNKIVNRLKNYQKKGLIKSIYLPRDITMVNTREIDGKYKGYVKPSRKKTKFQKKLDYLVEIKREIKESIKKINTFFE